MEWLIVESSSLSELSHPRHNIMYYKINVIHTTRLNSKAKSKKKKKRRQILNIYWSNTVDEEF